LYTKLISSDRSTCRNLAVKLDEEVFAEKSMPIHRFKENKPSV